MCKCKVDERLRWELGISFLARRLQVVLYGTNAMPDIYLHILKYTFGKLGLKFFIPKVPGAVLYAICIYYKYTYVYIFG